ncbi:MAG: hypothetical protein SFU21_13510, partial [Flavihumibacter sp.]|nr:hypothetical protein [Flavihumibacter sp.]
LCFGLTLFSCAGKFYTYKLAVIEPQKNDNMTFENDTMKVVFNFTHKGLVFNMYNKINEGIKINWDELSLSWNGNAQRVVHKETGILKTTDLQPPTTIPPYSNLSDILIPTDYITTYYLRGQPTPLVMNVFTDADKNKKELGKKFLANKGKTASIYMPYYIKGQFYSKTFVFIITDVMVSKFSPSYKK